MSDVVQSQEEGSPEASQRGEAGQEDPFTDTPPRRDVHLHLLIKIAEAGCNFGVTLQMGGLVVTGTVIGYEEYRRTIAPLITDAMPDEASRHAVKSFFQEVPATARALPPNYIHLKDAKFMGTEGSVLPRPGTMLWRGRLDAVDGFVLGTLSHGFAVGH